MSVNFELDANGAPIAPKIPKETVVHGDKLLDNYFWLRERENETVIKYLEAENDYTSKHFAHTEAGQKKLFDEMVSRIQQTDSTYPHADGAYAYYKREVEGLQYPFWCRKRRSADDELCVNLGDASEEIVLDENKLAEGHDFSSVGVRHVSPDGKYLAFSHDVAGDEVYTLYVRDIATQTNLESIEIENTYYSCEWSADCKFVYYTTLDDAHRAHQVWRLTVSTGETELVYEEKDERFSLSVSSTADKKYLLINAGSVITTEILIAPNDGSKSEFKVFCSREHDVEYWLDHQTDRWLIGISDGNRRNFHLCEVADAHALEPTKANWKELVAHDEAVTLLGVTCFKDYLALWERRGGLQTVRLQTRASAAWLSLSFPESVFVVEEDKNVEFEAHFVRIEYQSMIVPTPVSIMAVDMRTGELKLLKRTPVLGGFVRENYSTSRVWATAHDGVKIPITIVHHKDFKRHSGAPSLLYGYGSYGASIDPWFASKRFSLLDRGFLYAILHIRGGAEQGRQWYDEGKLLKKKNTFLDFISATKHLIAEGYATAGRIAAYGASAGGLLMGAVATMAPELYRAVVADVPFLDVINTQLDPTLPLVIGEYEEWGNPEKVEEYKYMLSYSPYDNVKAMDYPHLLAISAMNDPRVMYWEPAKWIAKVRALKTGKNVALLKTYMDEGHGGASGRYDLLKEDAFLYAFYCDKLGVTI